MLGYLIKEGNASGSRAGDVAVAPTPVTTVYEKPKERVLFFPERDANPFFHLMEALWMLAGRNDVAFLEFYNRRMKDFSDDGKTFHGAYGYRWRNHFGGDQISLVIDLLKNNPRTRRAVIQMWDCSTDLRGLEHGKDVPCNLVVTPWIDIEKSALNMTVFCRSNDIIWGAAGANAVHFSILQEYLASMFHLDVGVYYQISNNFHAYEPLFTDLLVHIADMTPEINEYSVGSVQTTPIVTDPGTFDEELFRFMNWHDIKTDYKTRPQQAIVDKEWKNKFFPEVAIPMALAYFIFRSKDPDRWEKISPLLGGGSSTNDWLYASWHWMQRHTREKDNGTPTTQ